MKRVELVKTIEGFGWDVPDKGSAQFNAFPHSLLQKCAELRIDIEVSVYRVSDSDDDGYA